MPQQVLLPIAAFFSCLLFVLILRKKRIKHIAPIAIIFAAIVFSFTYFYCYNRIYTKPTTQLANQTVNITADVVDVIAYRFDTTAVVAKISHMNNKKIEKQFKSQIFNVPYAEKGDNISLNVKFDNIQKNKYLFSNFAKSIYINASYIDGFTLNENQTNVILFFDKLQNILASNIKGAMTEQTGAVAAAMSVGEKSSLSAAVVDNYRAAGISHMLVVSGMHLSAISGLAYLIFRKTLKNKRVCAVLSIIFIFLFTLLTGITPSIVRAGTVLLFVYLSMIFLQNSDAVTSIALAGLILCLQNPYCAIDMGFLLSFSATLGILISNKLISKLWKNEYFANRKYLIYLISLVSVPLSASLATLPVLIGFGASISLVSVLINIIVVPVLPIIVACSFIIAIFANVPIFAWIVSISAFLCNILISFMNIISNFIANLSFTTIHISGIASLATVLILYALVFVSFKWPVKNKIIYLTIFLCFSIMIQILANINVVTVASVAAVQNTPVVVTQNGVCSVIFRGKSNSIKYVEDYLSENNIKKINYFLDMRESKVDEQLSCEFPIEKYVNTFNQDNYNTTFQLNDDIMVISLIQEKGSAVVVDVSGYKIAANSGEFDFKKVGMLDVHFAGQSKPQNLNATNIISSVTPKWSNEAKFDELIESPFTKVRIRPKKSVRIYEEFYGYN